MSSYLLFTIPGVVVNILAWLEAVELYERMKTEGGPIKPNFISISSVLIALDKAGQRELAENIYQEALKDKIFSPWRFTLDSKCTTRIRVMVRICLS